MNYVYILKCSDGTFYTGYTNNLEKRISVHNKGKGAKYTRGRLPVKLIYFEEYDSKSEALHREFSIKKMTRQNKLHLIKNCQQP
jgi:putative endonuclease